MTKDEALTLEALKYAASLGNGRIVREMNISPFSIGCVQHDCDECVARLAQPEEQQSCDKQEPVAWLVTGPYELVAFSNLNSAKAFCRGLNKGFGEEAYSIKMLYTAPPERRWVGLTDAEIQDCYNAAYRVVQGRRLEVTFARAIEAKLKEKNA